MGYGCYCANKDKIEGKTVDINNLPEVESKNVEEPKSIKKEDELIVTKVSPFKAIFKKLLPPKKDKEKEQAKPPIKEVITSQKKDLNPKIELNPLSKRDEVLSTRREDNSFSTTASVSKRDYISKKEKEQVLPKKEKSSISITKKDSGLTVQTSKNDESTNYKELSTGGKNNNDNSNKIITENLPSRSKRANTVLNQGFHIKIDKSEEQILNPSEVFFEKIKEEDKELEIHKRHQRNTTKTLLPFNIKSNFTGFAVTKTQEEADKTFLENKKKGGDVLSVIIDFAESNNIVLKNKQSNSSNVDANLNNPNKAKTNTTSSTSINNGDNNTRNITNKESKTNVKFKMAINGNELNN